MSDGSIHIDLNDVIFDEIRKLRAEFGTISGTVAEMEKKTNASIGGIGKQLKALNLVSIHQGFQNVSQELTNLSKPGMAFGSSLADVSAITGVVGKDLESLGVKARKSAVEFGGEASESLESYKTILSRLGPQIAENEKALADMERSGRILSKTMGGDMTGATDALTTALLQYGVDLSNPIEAQKEMARMSNVMAAGAKYGAAEVPQLSEALKQTGIKAKDAKLTFEETNSALQSLAAGGKFGSEAGIGLRNVLGKLAGEDVLPKEAALKLRKLGVDMNIVSNTSIPFTDRLRELSKASSDATIMSQVFGVENETTAKILINSIQAQDDLTKAITGTNVAEEQAKIVMESTAEKAKRQEAYIEDLKISFFDATGGATAFLEPVSQIGMTITAFSPIFSGAKSGLSFLKQQFDSTGGSAKGLSDGIDGIGKSATKSKGLMGGLGSALKGVGWTAIAAGIAMVASRIYDVATGATEVQKNLEAIRNGKEAGEKEASKFAKPIDSKKEKAITAVQNKLSAGDIDEKEARRQEIEIRKNALYALKGEYSSTNLKREMHERELSDQEKRLAKAKTGFFRTEETEQFFGSEGSEGAKTARARGRAASSYTEQKIYREKIEAEKAEIARLEAEQKGAGKKKPVISNPISPSGYTSSENDKAYQGTGGEMKNINIRIENLVKDITITTTNVTESVGQIKQLVTDALIASVRNTEVAL